MPFNVHRPLVVGIVGAELAKFTAKGQAAARQIIWELVAKATGVVSGGCHLGGVDIWAEEVARAFDIEPVVHLPAVRSWALGYMPRNRLIARDCDVLHNIVVDRLPLGYDGMRFEWCYHCHTDGHVKSGGCWTAKEAQRLGKQAHWHIIRQ